MTSTMQNEGYKQYELQGCSPMVRFWDVVDPVFTTYCMHYFSLSKAENLGVVVYWDIDMKLVMPSITCMVMFGEKPLNLNCLY